MSRGTLISVVGPTAIGKTAMAITLAKHLGTEILSADSRQFYKEMRIGTAVPTPEELLAVPHHFIHHKSVSEPYTVGDFERDAIRLLEELFARHKIVIMVGGSGLYVDAVTKGLDNFPKIDPAIRQGLNQTLTAKGIGELQRQLEHLDPDYYTKVDLDNPHRLIRALEVCLGSGMPYSSFLGKPKTDRPFDLITLGIRAERSVMYDRINQRVDLMMEQGLQEEARALYPHKHSNALQTVGYKELFKYFDGEWDLETAVSEIKKNTRRFAKRQMTWLNNDPDILWVHHDTDRDGVLRLIETKLRENEGI